MRDGPFVRGDDVTAAGKRGTNVRDRGLARLRAQRCDLDGHFGPRTIQEILHARQCWAEPNVGAQPSIVDRGAMARVRSDDAKRKNRAFALDKKRERAAYVTEANERDPQNSSFSIMELRFDSSAAFCFLCWLE